MIDGMEDDAESIIMTFANKQETRVYEKTNQIQKTAFSYKKVKTECFDTLLIPLGVFSKLSQKIQMRIRTNIAEKEIYEVRRTFEDF